MARELPIFPLPIVLFPGAPQPLHVFEPRYRQLLVDCQDGDRRFGIAYVAPDRAPAADPAPSAGDVGCVALIRSIQPLPDGRSNILAVGERRFVLRRWVEREPPRPYQVAEVEEFDDDPVDPAEAAALAADRSEEHTSELQSQSNLVCRLLLEKKKIISESYTSELPQQPNLICRFVIKNHDLDLGSLQIGDRVQHTLLVPDAEQKSVDSGAYTDLKF